MDQPQSSKDGPPKKSPLETLSKDELIKKCKGLLGLAQKAKQAKDEFAEENKKLKDELIKFGTQKDADKKSLIAMKEVVDVLTENKLSLTTQVSSLQYEKTKYEENIKVLQTNLSQSSEISIENEGLKRQVCRLTNENEALLQDLDNMEKKLEQVNELGIQQQKELILLEKETEKWKNLEFSIKELQEQLATVEQEKFELTEKLATLEEERGIKVVESLQISNKLHSTLESSEKLISTLQREKSDLCKEKIQLCEELERIKTDGTENREKEAENSMKYRKLEEKLEQQLTEIDALRKSEEKQLAKLQLFKTKILEFSGKLKKLKKSREILIETIQEYADLVPKWQKEIMNASNILSTELINYEKENKMLKEKIENLEVVLRESQLSSNSNNHLTALFSQKVDELLECANKIDLEFEGKCKEVLVGNKNINDLKNHLSFAEAQLHEEIIKSENILKENNNLKNQLENLVCKQDGQNEQHENKKLENLKNKLVECCDEIEFLKQSLSQVQNERDKLRADNEKNLNQIEDLKKEIIDINENFAKVLHTNSDLQETVKTLELSRKDISFEVDTDLIKKVNQLQNFQQEKDKYETALEEKNGMIENLESLLSNREQENSDLLSEMRELNEALKGRGDVISRQQEKIKDLELEVAKTAETLCTIQSNLSEKEHIIIEKNTEIDSINKEMISAKNEMTNLSVQSKESEKLIKHLSEEVTSMRDKITSDNQSEVLSTSTISRAEELSRLREVDESFEEKYNKLRSLAIKLKKKVQEQTAYITKLENDRKSSDEKNENPTRLQVKNLQALQNENDKLLDELEKLRKENSNSQKQIEDLIEQLKTLVTKNNQLQIENDDIKSSYSLDKKSKTSLDSAVKEYQNQIKVLKQEKESFNLIRKEIEKERDQLKMNLSTKEKDCGRIQQQLDSIKNELDKCKVAGKKSSVLNLEIEAYEKSLTDITQKLDQKNNSVKELNESLTSKEDTIKSLNEQIKLLEESIESEKAHSIELKQQNEIQNAKLKESEHDKVELRTCIQDITKECESLKTEVNELHLQMSDVSSEKDKLCASLQNEKDKLLRQAINLEETLEATHTKLKSNERELEDIRAEYASYKIRAQAVLRQNQSKESSRERELEEELTTMQSTTEALSNRIKTCSEIIETNEKKFDDLQQDNERIQKRCKELMQLLEESRVQNEAILNDNQRHNSEYQESLKTHRLQIETLNNCYKKQIEDLKQKHISELEEIRKLGNTNQLASRIGPFGGPKATDEQKIDLILMEREDAEGSENIVTIPRRRISTTRSKRDLMPLDELLNSSFETQNDDERSMSPSIELQITKEKLSVQESRVKHLTSLLSETEQDLAKLNQMNDVLKEEVRRQERTMEREPHMNNSEYLKNVVLKFLTLSSGDERSRLVPVINTILKLSPDETQALQNVAKGVEAGQRSWGSFLPIWSNHQ